MAVAGWILDKSAAARADVPAVADTLDAVTEALFVCPVGELEQLYSALSARDYDRLKKELHSAFEIVTAPADILERALLLQKDLAHHHGMWHRTPIADLLVAETALHHTLGVVHVDRDFDRIARVRPLRCDGSRPDGTVRVTKQSSGARATTRRGTVRRG